MALKKLILARTILFNSQSTRKLSLTASKCDEAIASKSEVRLSWNRALDDAIKCVNYQSPFLKLSYMTTDKNINWSKNLDKLEKSGHPMYDTAKILYTEGKANANQIWGIVALLVSKLAGYPKTNSWNEDDFDNETRILKSQRNFAEYIELLALGNEFHRDGVLNIHHLNKSGMNLDNDSSLIFGNKIAILAGDMLLGYSNLQIAKLRNHKISTLLATCVRDTVDSNFIGDRDVQNNPLPSDPFKKLDQQKNNPKIFEEISSDQIDIMLPFKTHDVMGTAENEWKLHHTLGGASRLGKSFQAALILGKHNDEKLKEIYFLGKHMYLSYRAAKDLIIFKSNELPLSGKFSLVSAPLLFHLEEYPLLYEDIKKGLESIENIDFAKIHKIVRNGQGMKKTKDFLIKNNLTIFTLLHKFPKSETRRAIENLILTLVN